MRWGVLGYGAFGRLHARFLAAQPGVVVAAIATRSADNRAAAAAAHPGARIATDWRALVTAPDLDAIAVVTPNDLHAPITLAALEEGKAVLVEKPLATTLEDCARVVEAVERTRGLVSVGFEMRLSAQWGAVKALIDDGTVGRPTFLDLGLFRFPFRPGGEGWRHDPARVGSWILEEPIHHVDLMLWWLEGCGAPVEVSAHGRARADGLVPSFRATIRFADGAVATLGQSLEGFGHHLRVELIGRNGALRGLWSAADARSEHPVFSLLVQEHGAGEPVDRTPRHSGELVELEAEIAATVAAFAAGRTLVPAEAGRRAVALCLAIERSLRSGRPAPVAGWR